MPRRAFIADLAEAATAFSRPNVLHIRAGEDDGQVVFEYTYGSTATEITCLVPDLGDYPDSHHYMYFTNADHVDAKVEKAIHSLHDCHNMAVSDMLVKVVKHLDKATSAADSQSTRLQDDNDEAMDLDPRDEEDMEDAAPFESEDDEWDTQPTYMNKSTSARNLSTTEQNLANRMRQDLRLAQAAGFRVSQGGTLAVGGREGFVTLSIRVSKLGISEEALDAWNMEPNKYFIIILKYDSGYQSLDDLIGYATCNVKVKVGLSNRYKVSAATLNGLFAQSEQQSKRKSKGGKTPTDGQGQGLGRLFIGRPLDELLNSRLIPMIKYRQAMGFGWQGAEEFFNDSQGRNLDNDAPDPKYWAEEKVRQSHAMADHFTDDDRYKSFPLITMQYALRHLVRCTEFCLVCHCKVEANFEALKPYVCSKPLCLYQYMSLGFGPSIEHEIIAQPSVVDLLISFCYVSAFHRKIRHLPSGLALMVPASDYLSEKGVADGWTPYSGLPAPTASALPESSSYTSYNARYDAEHSEILMSSGESAKRPPLVVGTWITMGRVDKQGELQHWHCRVQEMRWPIFVVSRPIKPVKRTVNPLNPANESAARSQPSPAPTPPPFKNDLSQSSYEPIKFVIWDHNFDDLDNGGKFGAIKFLLDILPSVTEMKSFLLGQDNQEVSLRSWSDRIPTSALGLLRWILASNRSCIVQVDSVDGGNNKSEERVSGMPGWMQFRFAQGAPDKEQRFITSIKDETSEFKHQTVFAWHGSPLYNWHGIVREGLNCERVDHGRAHGNGVYHAMDVSTSLGYSGGYYRHSLPAQTTADKSVPPGQWMQSQLKITQSIALNEIINAPDRFTSKAPFLVVPQLDWIQTRYLFVQCNIDGWKAQGGHLEAVFEQDPAYHPKGMNGQQINLPLNAISKARLPKKVQSPDNANKKLKVGSEDLVEMSEESETEDTNFLYPELASASTDPLKENRPPVPPKDFKPDSSKLPFKPNTLDAKSITLLSPPSYATSSATKSLQRELQSTLKLQCSQPPHELGWSLNPDLITTVYQWIIELHSFELDLPLAKDMASQNIQSIVAEIRFGATYPMSPPFVRIIRPRFLPFMAGGGGHVTMGGALCMELLTNSGWSAVNNIESVLLQVRMAISSTDPKPARLDLTRGSRSGKGGSAGDYSVGEAVEAFVRACRGHGWEIPPDFQKGMMGM